MTASFAKNSFRSGILLYMCTAMSVGSVMNKSHSRKYQKQDETYGSMDFCYTFLNQAYTRMHNVCRPKTTDRCDQSRYTGVVQTET